MTDQVKEVKLDFKLHPAQMEVFQCPARFIVLAAGRRFGKSDLALKRAITSALHPGNTRALPVWIVAPVQPQAKAIYWQPLLRLTAPVRRAAYINDGLVELVNGVQIVIKGSDRPDTLRGVGLWDLVLDEYATMKPETWDEILAPAMSDVRGRALFIGTPAGRNHFYRLCEYAWSGEDPEWAYFHFPSTANPYLPAGEVEAARRRLSTRAFQQEYMASFETGAGGLFSREWIKYNPNEPKTGNWYVAVDLAGFGVANSHTQRYIRLLDKTAIAVVKVDQDGKWWVRDITMGRWNVEETCRRILSAVESVQAINIGIERGTMFNAVEPILRAEAHRRRIPLFLRPLSHGNESKVNRIVWALQGRFEHGNIELNPGPWNEEFVDQLVNVPSKMVHDDGPDALALVDQMASKDAFMDFGHESGKAYWKPLDITVGY